MGNLVETNTFSPTITQIEVTDFVEGGANGIDNKPHIELANRTTWLKNAIDAFVSGVTKVKNAILADTATKLETPRNINGVPFDGSADIDTELYVMSTESPDTTTKSRYLLDTNLKNNMYGIPVAANYYYIDTYFYRTRNSSRFQVATQYTSVGITPAVFMRSFYNSTWTNWVEMLTSNSIATSATKLETPRNINGVPFDGSDDIQLPALPVIGYSSNTTLTQDKSGGFVILNGDASEDTTFTLPAVKNGSYFAFFNNSNYKLILQTPNNVKFYGSCRSETNQVVIYPGCILEIGCNGGNWLGLSMDYGLVKGYRNGETWWQKTATFIQGVGVVAWIKQGSVVDSGTTADTVFNLPIAFSSVFQCINGQDIGNYAGSFGFNLFGSLSQFKLTGRDSNGYLTNLGCRYIAEGY